MQSASATQAPVIDAVRVPPSAWITSQSTVIWRSPSATRSTAARSERPIRRWISTVRPPCLPAEASRRVRSSGGARQHAVFGGDPAAALALQPGRQALFQRGGHQHMGVAEFHHAGTFGVFDHAALQRHGAQFIGRTAAWPHGKILPNVRKSLFAVLVGGGERSGKGRARFHARNACLSGARRMDRLGAAKE